MIWAAARSVRDRRNICNILKSNSNISCPASVILISEAFAFPQGDISTTAYRTRLAEGTEQ